MNSIKYNNTTMVFNHIPADSRLQTFPISPSRQELWNRYKQAVLCIWTVEEVKLRDDAEHYNRLLNDKERHFVKYILAFFSSFDAIVNINLAERFRDEVKILEVRYFYDFQIMMENIHAEMYALMLETIIRDPVEKESLLTAVHTLPIIAKMARWANKWIHGEQSEASFATRLVAMSAVEGVLFTGAFCAIYWLANRGGIMPGFTQANEFIARDERCHTAFAVALYEFIEPAHKLSDDRIYAIFDEAVNLSIEFIAEALPIDLLEMNQRLMGQYIRHMTDNILIMYGLAPKYGDRNPFPFMAQINLPNKTDFFVKNPTEYSGARGETSTFEDISDF